jgi:hypothetical protein
VEPVEPHLLKLNQYLTQRTTKKPTVSSTSSGGENVKNPSNAPTAKEVILDHHGKPVPEYHEEKVSDPPVNTAPESIPEHHQVILIHVMAAHIQHSFLARTS